jgi:hypothetical protein
MTRNERKAQALYHKMQTQASLKKWWGRLTGRQYELLDLAAFAAANRVSHRRYLGTMAVPVASIRGSEDRIQDFDAGFRPLQDRSKYRWLRIAAAVQDGEMLPPVELIQVGENYFVRDGHHRVSVARALQQDYVDAEVTEWQLR